VADAAVSENTRRAIWPGGVVNPYMPYSPAIQAGPWVFVAGQVAWDFETGLAPECQLPADIPYRSNPLRLQSGYILENIRKTCEEAGASLDDDSVRIYQWLETPGDDSQNSLAEGLTIYREEQDRFLTHDHPGSSSMHVRDLLIKDCILEVDTILKTDTPKETIPGTPDAPAGSTKGVISGDWVFTSGENAADDHGTGDSPEGDEPSSHGVPITARTHRTLDKLERTLESAGSSMDDVVHATIYCGHPRTLPQIEKAWQERFPEDPPAKTIVPQVAAGLGIRGYDPTIALVALKKGGETRKASIMADGVPSPIFHEPHAVKAGDLLFFSTQIAGDGNGLCADGRREENFPYYGLPARSQMQYVLENTTRICEAAGTSLANICRRQAFHTDFNWFMESIDEYARWFPKEPPASTTLEIGGPLHVEGALFVLDLIGYCP
jgi:enamine deaminase RidA (YjgF/YER057c/UK114 family)